MFRVLVRAAVLVCLAVPLVGCGGGDDGGSGGQEVSSETIRPQPQEQSAGERIPEKAEPLDVLEGFEIKPYFDEHGSLSELAVSPGDQFELYVVLAYPDPYHVNALEYRLELPEGVKILAESKYDNHVLTIGDPLEDFSMAGGCKSPGRYYVMKYFCEVDAAFVGGEIETTPGLNKYGKLFLGVVTCEPGSQKIPAQGGIAVLKKN